MKAKEKVVWVEIYHLDTGAKFGGEGNSWGFTTPKCAIIKTVVFGYGKANELKWENETNLQTTKSSHAPIVMGKSGLAQHRTLSHYYQ